MPYHGVININKPKFTNTTSNTTIKTPKQHPRILVWCLLLLILNSYFFIVTNFVGVQQQLSAAIQNLDYHTIRYELKQKRLAHGWGVCIEAMVKFTKRLKEVVQIMYLHRVGSVFTIIRIISGILFLPKVTRKEILSSASSCEAMDRS